MLNMRVWSGDNALTYGRDSNTYHIKEVLSVQVEYLRTVEDMQAYNAMVKDLITVLMKHCPNAKLPFTPEQMEDMFSPRD